MSNTLFIYLTSPDPAMPVEAIELSKDGEVIRPAFSTTLETLGAAQPDARVVALIPGSEALSTSATLPRVGASQLRKMLPFALEDQIAGDLGEQHFAIGRPTSTSTSTDKKALTVSAIAIRRETICAYRDSLRSVGLEPVQIYLDESFVAAKPGDVIAWIKGDEIFLRSPDGLGLRCQLEDISMALDMIAISTALSNVGLQVVGVSADLSHTDREFDEIARRFSRMTRTNLDPHSLSWLVAQYPLADPINLLQGDLSPRHSGRRLDPRWKLPASLAAVLLVLVLISHGLTWRQANLEEAALDLAMTQSGGDPSSTTPIEPLPLRRALLALANSGLPDASVAAVEHQGGVTRVTLTRGTSPDSIIPALRSAGWRVDATTDDQSRAVLTLIDAGSEA